MPLGPGDKLRPYPGTSSVPYEVHACSVREAWLKCFRAYDTRLPPNRGHQNRTPRQDERMLTTGIDSFRRPVPLATSSQVVCFAPSHSISTGGAATRQSVPTRMRRDDPRLL